MSCSVIWVASSTTMKFSIPMRGNEVGLLVHGRIAARKFSIPMRGNEDLANRQFYAAFTFSIPMRGNEAVTDDGQTIVGPEVFDPHEG